MGGLREDPELSLQGLRVGNYRLLAVDHIYARAYSLEDSVGDARWACLGEGNLGMAGEGLRLGRDLGVEW